MSKPREWWIDPDYDGYFDDTDESLIASGFVKAVEHSAYQALLERLASDTELFNKELRRTTVALAKAVEALKRIKRFNPSYEYTFENARSIVDETLRELGELE